MTSFALPPTAQAGDRLPDVWLRFADGGRIKLHMAFGRRRMWLAVGVPKATLAAAPEGTDALYSGDDASLVPGWRCANVDAA